MSSPPAAPEGKTSDTPTLLNSGIQHLDAGSHADALPCFRAATGTQPDNILAWSYLGLSLAIANEQATARDIWTTHGISDNRGLRLRIILWMESKWLRDRSFFYPRKAAIPEDKKGSRSRGFRHFYAQRFEQAFAEFVSCGKSTPEIHFATAYCAELLQDYELALDQLAQLPETDDQWPDDMIALKARCLVRLGHLTSATDLLNRVTILGPYDYSTNYFLGVICLAGNKVDAARLQFKHALNRHYVDTLEYQWWQIQRCLLQFNWEYTPDNSADPLT